MAGICTKVKCHAQKCMRAKKEPLSWHWLRGCRKTQGKAGKSRSPFALCASLLSILPSRLAPCHLPIPPSRLTPRHRSTVQHGRLASCAKRTCDVPCFTGLTTACFAHCARPSCAPPTAAQCSGAAHCVCSRLQPFGPPTGSDRDGNAFFPQTQAFAPEKMPEMTYTPSFLIKASFF